MVTKLQINQKRWTEKLIFWSRQSQWTKLPLDIRWISANSRVSSNLLRKTEQNRHFLTETKTGKPRRRRNKLAWPYRPRKGKSGAGSYHVSAAGRLRIQLSRFLHSTVHSAQGYTQWLSLHREHYETYVQTRMHAQLHVSDDTIPITIKDIIQSIQNAKWCLVVRVCGVFWRVKPEPLME